MKRRLLACLVAMAMWPVPGHAQSDMWETHVDAGMRAAARNEYVVAEREYRAALDLAGQFAPSDLRLAQSLRLLAVLYLSQDRYDEAGPILERALAIRKKSPQPDRPTRETVSELNEMAILQDNLAIVYLHQGRDAEALALLEDSLVIWKVVVGGPGLVYRLRLYADWLNRAGLRDEATKMEARAEAIRARIGWNW